MTMRILVLSVFLLLGCSTTPLEPAVRATHYEPTDKILILGAVPQEIPPFVDAMTNVQKKTLWGVPYWEGDIEGKPVIVAITGIGKTFTGATSTLFITQFQPRLVLMSGTGARINQDLRTGDVIVATAPPFSSNASTAAPR